MSTDDIETLETTASETEQPVSTQADESASQEASTTAPVEVTPKLYAGKFKSVEDLESSYLSAASEASRMAQQLAQRAPEPAQPPAEKTYTVDQLESYKEGHLLEMMRANSAAQVAYSNGNIQEAQQLEAKAQQSARQIRMIDAELRKTDIQSTIQSTKRQSAEEKLRKDAVGVIQQFKSDLVEGTEFHSKALDFLSTYEAMGQDVKNPIVQAQAVAMAAQALGVSAKKIQQTTRKELASSISQALKTGVQAGAGKATVTPTQPDFKTMSDAAFAKWKAERGLSN